MKTLERWNAANRREKARAYFATVYANRPDIFDDVMQRYDSNYNGMGDHWDRVLPFILGEREIPLNERRGQ